MSKPKKMLLTYLLEIILLLTLRIERKCVFGGSLETTRKEPLYVKTINLEKKIRREDQKTNFVYNPVNISLKYNKQARDSNYCRKKRSEDGSKDSNAFLNCTLTPNGIDYIGKASNTKGGMEGGKECLFWISPQVSKVTALKDMDFPDGSKQEAKRYCRNPDKAQGPWCFTEGAEKTRCNIDYCFAPNCSLSGPGFEYIGQISKSMYDNPCISWSSSDIPKYVANGHFPDGDHRGATNFCRNPTEDVVGPYCYVEDIDKVMETGRASVVKEYCDIPLCDLLEEGISLDPEIGDDYRGPEVSVVNGVPNDQFYTHFTKIDIDREELNMSLKLWSPGDLFDAQVSLALSVLPVPAQGKHMRSWNTGFELLLSMKKTGVYPQTDDDESWKITPKLLVGTNWVNLTLQWSQGFIALKYSGEEFLKSPPILIHNYQEKTDTVFSLQRKSQLFYSLRGSPTLLKVSSSTHDVPECQEHLTSREDYYRFFPLTYEHDIKIMDLYVKSHGDCSMLFKMSPVMDNAPEAKLFLRKDGRIHLTLKMPNKNPEELALQRSPGLLSNNKWVHFIVKIGLGRFQLFSDSVTGLSVIVDAINAHFNILRWLSVGSLRTTHWIFRCEPNETFVKSVSDCSVSKSGKAYKGSHWVTETGKPCLPWVSKFAPPEEMNFKGDETPEEAINYCRNTNENERGAFCYVFDVLDDMIIKKEYCELPKCITCRQAGIGTDFDGQLNVTISNITCQNWTSDKPHKIPPSFKRNELFPERNVKAVANYCRNPNLDIAGPWCVTMDKAIIYEPCEVKDCDRPKDCTLILVGETNKKILITPKFRQYGIPIWLKIWNPLKYAGLKIRLYKTAEMIQYFEVQIGETEGSSASIRYFSGSGNSTILERKNIDHLIGVGTWTGFTLVIKYGLIKLHLSGVPNAILSWTHMGENEITPFQPYYLNYSLIDEGPLGISFNCEDGYPEIQSNSSNVGVYYPINIWRQPEDLIVRNITYFFRGDGMVDIKFYSLPSMGHGLRVNLNDFGQKIGIYENLTGEELLTNYKYRDKVITNYEWTNITIVFKDKKGHLYQDSSFHLDWNLPTGRRMNFYYFTVEVTDGEMMWTVNCEPPEIDGEPRQGGWTEWGPWECSRPCGVGIGTRRRNCTQPKPSFFGDLCEGEEKMTGECNTWNCGLVSPITLRDIKVRLKMSSLNFVIDEGEAALLPCYPDLLAKIRDESPTSRFYWYKNEDNLKDEQANEVDPEKFQLNFTAKVNDSGTYICGVRVGNTFNAMQLTVLVVKNFQTPITSQIGSNFFLDCKCLQLSSVYGNLLLRWFHNNTMFKEQELSKVTLMNKMESVQVFSNTTGIWQSILLHKGLKLSWTTNWINLTVLPKKSFMKNLVYGTSSKKKSTSPNVGIFIVSCIMFIVTVAIMYAIYSAMKSATQKRSPLIVTYKRAETEDKPFFGEESDELSDYTEYIE